MRFVKIMDSILEYSKLKYLVKTSEASLSGQSPVKYAPNSESTLAYQRLAKEVEQIDKTIAKNKHEFSR